MMISRRSKANGPKDSIPRQNVFGMNQCQPVGVQCSKGHVGPNVASLYQSGGNDERDQDHDDGIGHGPVKGIKESWVGESVMWFVGLLIKRWRYHMLESVHGILQSILQDQTSKCFVELDASLKAVVACRHPFHHPRDGQIQSQQDKAFWLCQMSKEAFLELIFPSSLGLDRSGEVTAVVEIAVFE